MAYGIAGWYDYPRGEIHLPATGGGMYRFATRMRS